MEFHRDTAICAHQKYQASGFKLVDLVLQGWFSDRIKLKICQAAGIADRVFDIGNDGIREAKVPAVVIEFFGIIAHIFIVEKAFHCWRPVKRPFVHLSGALYDHIYDVLWIFRGRRKAGVLEAIYPCLQSAADFLRAVGMCHHRKPVFMGFVHDGLHLVHGHFVLVNQFYAVHPGICKFLDFGPCICYAIDPPAEGFCTGVRFMLQKRP